MRTAQLLVCLGTLCLCVQVDPVLAQSTVFTYQGSLNVDGAAANGTYDFRFRLAADPQGNAYVGSPYLTNGIMVTNGLFVAALDFGPGIFNGANYWLEVSVRTNSPDESYAPLTPLQPILSTPYAMFAGAAANVSGAIALAQLPSAVITNGASEVALSGTFSGSGSGLTNLLAPTQSDYLFAYANSGVLSTGSFVVYKYVVGAGSNITFNSQGPTSGWTAGLSRAGQTFVAAHAGVYWVQYSLYDTYPQGGYPHFQATLNGLAIPGSQCTPIMQGNTTTSFIAAINAGDRLAIQCTGYSSETLGTWTAGYFASLNIVRIK